MRARVSARCRYTLGLGLLAIMASGSWAGADDAPDWLASAARSVAPPLDPKSPAEVLLDDCGFAVNERGIVEARVRHAVRIRTREGRAHALARAHYATDSDKVRELRAWLIGPNGEVKRLGKDEMVDVALAANDVYDEHRVRLIDASGSAEVGSVFGFESVVERRSFFNQLQWIFQSQLPSRLSRLELALPDGWTYEAHAFNHPKIEPVRSATGWAFELRELPYLADEPFAPGLSSLAPRLALGFAPPAGVATDSRSFASWEQVARWASEISDPRSEPDAAVVAKARELTRDAADERQRLEAIARFVQAVPYISIQVGLGRFQPHAAPQVLGKLYGDCKDKVALMRALLKAVGISAYPVLVFSSDRSYVRREWPSPTQFDHAIIAVVLGKQATPGDQGAVVQHPRLGTLLLFDPTDEHTHLGDLPEDEQGGLGLLAAASGGDLITLPVIPSAASLLESEARGQLSETGALSIELRERRSGQVGVRERRLWRSQPRPDYVASVERWLAQDIPGVRATRVEAGDSPGGGFRLDVDFSSDRYGQLMQDRLLVFKPAVVARQDFVSLPPGNRQHPVVLYERASHSTARIRLPQGFAVDETPAPVAIETPFGRYSMSVAAVGEELVVERRYATRAVTLPPADYPSARGFFQRVVDAEQAPVVLIRKQ